MKPKLFEWLVCPRCGTGFTQTVFTRDGEDVADGLLSCSCGAVYPVVDTIPRILDDAFALFPEFRARYAQRLPAAARATAAAPPDAIRKTRDSFGYQWTLFSEMVVDFRKNFLNYIQPVDEAFFRGKVGVDVGCGFGRHIYNAAAFGAEMVGVDISAAIDVTRRNTRQFPNVHLVQANVYQLPFREGTFDFAYSIGVLHHLPDPEAAYRNVVRLVRSGGAVFVWVYSKLRGLTNRVLEAGRAVTTKLPAPMQRGISFAAAVVDWTAFVLPCKALLPVPGLGGFVRQRLPRGALYSGYPFQVTYADWFDRLAAPIRFYYDGDDMQGWLARAGLTATRVSPTGLYGWRAYGERR